QIADDGLGAAGDLAKADDPLVCPDLHKNDLGAVHELMGGPTALLQRDRQRMGDDFGDLHGSSPVNSGVGSGATNHAPDRSDASHDTSGKAVFRLPDTHGRHPATDPRHAINAW